jgi:CheY-like chemotaxis protein/DNA-directed RNA polymerase specialized sigma24 family protein
MASVASSVREHLPYLRRYARSLTGEQASGDAYVGALLEAVASDPDTLDPGVGTRVGLYRAFTRLWSSIGVNLEAGAAPARPDGSLVDNRLGAMMPVPRQAFLLVSVEGFTPEETGVILGRSQRQIESDLEEAGREIAAQVATDVLIIEDEPLIGMDLQSVVSSIGHRVTEIARTKAQALKAVKRKKPGLILADVQLADGSSGLDAVHEILGGISVPVIFITAYPEDVLTGLRPEPTFLIPKPFRPETVKTIISQALFFDIRSHNKDAA